MIFKLGTTDFEIDENESCFYIDTKSDTIRFSVDVYTQRREYCDEQHAPSLDIRWFTTKQTEISGLVGVGVSVSTIEKSYKREDTFYLYEHEPFVKYRLKIIDICDERVHVSLKGIVVKDGYAKPYTTETLEIECWLRIRYLK